MGVHRLIGCTKVAGGIYISDATHPSNIEKWQTSIEKYAHHYRVFETARGE